MEVIVGKTAGFCFGVKNAIENTEKQIKNEKNIYCLGELVHNKQVIEELKAKGVIFINDIKEAKNKVIIRAHGAEKQTYETAEKNDVKIVDLTCPKVLFIHKLALEYAEKNYYIFLIGKKEHPEIQATKSFCGEKYTIIQEFEDIDKAVEDYKATDCNKILILAQTTYNLNSFNKIVDEIKNQIINSEIEIKNTICNATQNRQEETIKIAKTVEAMIVIGGQHSSNSIELYETAKQYCKNVQFIETIKELDLQKLNQVNKIGIMAGASTPEKSIKDVLTEIQAHFPQNS